MHAHHQDIQPNIVDENDTAGMISMQTPRSVALRGSTSWWWGVSLLGSAAGGACLAVLVMTFVIPMGGETQVVTSAPALAASGVVSGHLSFFPTKAEEALGELSPQEIAAVANYFKEHGIHNQHVSPTRGESPVWISGMESIQLLTPPKSLVLAYLDKNGPVPPRFARVRVVGPSDVMEYSVGPIVDGSVAADATVQQLLQPGAVPFTKRPEECGGDDRFSRPVLHDMLEELGEDMLVGTFGPIFPQFKSYNVSAGQLQPWLRNGVLSNKTMRIATQCFLRTPPPSVKPEAAWLYPLPFQFRLDLTADDVTKWNNTFDYFFCGYGPYPSAKALRQAFESGIVKGCPMYYDHEGNWSVPQRTTPRDPAGLTPKEKYRGVSWGPWNFTVTQRPGTGLALHDIRFGNERILYELSLQDAQAAYSGLRKDQFYYADASWSLSQISSSLEPGVDCPKGAHFLSAAKWVTIEPGGLVNADPTKAEDFFPICVFEFEEDHTIWRHMQNNDGSVAGLTRRTVVVRSIATVGNYDYLIDVKLREDGEIQVHNRFAGYIESRYFHEKVNPHEREYSTILRPGLAGPVHGHLVSWKADFDIGGVLSNALRVTKVKSKQLPTEPGISGDWPLSTKYLETSVIEQEGPGVSTFVADPKSPGAWTIVDRHAVSAAGNPRGYAVSLATWASLQVLPDDHPFTRSQPFTKYHLAVTKHHDEEYRVNSPYDLYDPWNPSPTQNLDIFLSDQENLLDEDLVAWIGVGREHITRQEDLPLVSNFGAGFSLMPWNFFQVNAASNR